MSIYKRGRYWHFEFEHDGVRYRGTTRCTKRGDAEIFEARKKIEIVDGKIPLPASKRKLDFNDLAEGYLKWYEKRNSKSFYTVISNVKNLQSYFGNTKLSALEQGYKIITEYREKRLSGEIVFRKKTICKITTNRELAQIRAMINWGIGEGMMKHSPFDKIKLDTAAEREAMRVEYLTRDEIPVFLDCCSEGFRPIATLAIQTGCRKSELTNLTWGDVELDDDLTYGIFRLKPSMEKAGKGRIVKLNATSRAVLGRLRAKTPNAKPTDYVLPRVCIRNEFQRALKKSGIAANRAMAGKKIRFHDLRHSHAVMLITATKDIDLVRQSLGHSSLSMTMRYAHITNERYQDGVEALAEYTEKTLSPQSPHTAPDKDTINAPQCVLH